MTIVFSYPQLFMAAKHSEGYLLQPCVIGFSSCEATQTYSMCSLKHLTVCLTRVKVGYQRWDRPWERNFFSDITIGQNFRKVNCVPAIDMGINFINIAYPEHDSKEYVHRIFNRSSISLLVLSCIAKIIITSVSLVIKSSFIENYCIVSKKNLMTVSWVFLLGIQGTYYQIADLIIWREQVE